MCVLIGDLKKNISKCAEALLALFNGKYFLIPFRAPISDPEQDQVSTPASSNRYYSQSPKPRNLHATK